MSLKLQSYDFVYPEHLIALEPSAKRDGARLLHVARPSKSITHKMFNDIIHEFQAGDVLVFNNSKVFPCRLCTQRKSGGKQEIFLLRNLVATSALSQTEKKEEVWLALLGPNDKVKSGDVFEFENLQVTILNDAEIPRKVKLKFSGDLFCILNKIGHIPLPSYIKRADTLTDQTRYQTVYAEHVGSVAAPTAGLHFTPELLQVLQNKGVSILQVTLHVGLGTFLPVKTENISDHKMHSEFFSIEPKVWQTILQAKAEKKRITAVGTTSVRVLETMAKTNFVTDEKCRWQEANLFIHPPYAFKIVDRLLTNFHQPKSTLLMLVSAFAGQEFILSAYAEAIKQNYRLFSYGDAMLIA